MAAAANAYKTNGFKKLSGKPPYNFGTTASKNSLTAR
jgi:hypothetical protein